MPANLAPMLAEPRDAPFNRADWMWEPKLDGYRALAYVDGSDVRLRSRNELELGAAFPQVAQELAQQAVNGMIIDGELVAFDAAGRPSFAALQDRAQLKTEREIAAAERSAPVVFYGFDLLYFGGVDLRKAPYADRRRYLAQCLLPTPRVQLVHAADDGVALSTAALASGFEGVVGKRKTSRYEAGRRSPSWVKVKPVITGEFVVGGYTQGKGARAPLGALLVGYWGTGRDRRKLHYASHVGSGFDARSLAATKKRLDKLARAKCPFAETPPQNAPATWVEPKVVAEVAFHSFTPDGALRAPVFVRMRDDLDAKAIHRPGAAAAAADDPPPRGPIDAVLAQLDGAKASFTLAVGEHRIRLTHLDRVYWPADASLDQPALTKRDLLRYFAQASPYILTHLADRPLTMIRMPEGIGGGSASSRSTGATRGRTSSSRSPCSRARRMNSTSTCCATTSRRCCGSRSRVRSNSTSGTRARSVASTRCRRVPTTHRRSLRSNGRC